MNAPPTTPARPLRWRRLWPVAVLGLVLAGLLAGARVGLPGEFDPTAPFRVGTDWGLAEALAERGPPVTAEARVGYDGQWFLGQAYDPLVRGEIVTIFDRPQYRALRPLYPVAGWLLAAGQPALIPAALLLVGMLAVALGCAACGRIATAYRRSRWWGLLFAAIPGVLVGVGYGTAEPLGLALAALGLGLVLDRRYGWAGAAFAGAALTKETYLAFGAAVALFLLVEGWRRGGWPALWRGWERGGWLRPAVLVAAVPAATLVGWWAYVSAVVPASQRTPNHLLDPPLLGWWRVARQVVRGEYAPYPLEGPVALGATFLVLVAALAMAVRHHRSVLAYPAVLWSVFGLSLVSIMLERFLSAQRVLAPAVLAALLLLVTAWPARRDPRSPAPAAAAAMSAAPARGNPRQ